MRRKISVVCSGKLNRHLPAAMAGLCSFSVLKWWILICFFSEFAVEGLMNESRLFMSGKVLRVLLVHVKLYSN